MARSPPTPVQFIVELVAKVGLVDFHPKPNTRRDWKAVFWQFIGYFQHFLVGIYIFFHFLSSTGRSIRYMPEFFQVFYEDCINLFGLIFLQIAYHFYADIKSVANFMETSLSNADKKVTEMYQKKAKLVLCVLVMSVGGALAATLFEKLLPLSEHDLDMLRFIYRTKHPERRLFVNVWIPFIDETESGYFEVIYALELVSFVLLHLTVITIGGLLPVSIAHIEGQYTILSTYVEKIGRIHRDVRGNTVYYTNIENNEYVTKQLTKPAVRLRLPSKKIQIQNHQRELHKELLYERLYFRQVVMFHQKLNTLQSKVIVSLFYE
uniref:Odorant receptor n=1 Tax=Cacopsylla melanoneura TaxID=428564 RepID=A0A8D9EE66_9HEMI